VISSDDLRGAEHEVKNVEARQGERKYSKVVRLRAEKEELQAKIRSGNSQS
jgi:hypothetical protein